MTPDEAKTRERTLEAESREAVGALLRAINGLWLIRADEMARIVVTGQPERTMSLASHDELGELRTSVKAVIQKGAESIDSLFKPFLDVDDLASRARLNTTGGVRIKIDGPIEALAQPLHDVLTQAGYRTETLKTSEGSYSSSAFTAGDMKITPYAEVSAFESLVERLGKARLAVAAAEHAIQAERAATAWDAV